MKMQVDDNGKVSWTIKSGGRIYRYYEDSKIYPSDVWTDISHLHQRDPERIGMIPKAEALLERIILSSSRPGDVVADFCRFWDYSVCCHNAKSKMDRNDSSPHAMNVCRKRLLGLGARNDFAIYYKGKSRPIGKSELIVERVDQYPDDGENSKGYTP